MISTILFPDTLDIQPESSTSLYQMRISDLETLADIDSVVTHFYNQNGAYVVQIDGFNDDGNNGDQTANDGWYSMLIGNPNNPDNAGDWTLRIYATDKAGNKTSEINRTLHLRNP